MGLGIIFCGLLYTDVGVLIYSFLTGIDLYFFYGVTLDYPESWLIPKFAFLAILAFITVISLRFRVFTYAKLMNQTKDYQRIYDHTRVALITIDREGIIQSINPTTMKILGYTSSNSLIGVNISVIGVDQEKQYFWRKELTKNDYIDDVELTLTKKDGSSIFVLMSASLIRDKEGKAQKIETVFRDITELKKTESVRKDLEKKREDFITMTNHQIRTPLHITKGYSEFLISKIDVLPPEDLKEYLYSLQRNLNRLEKLISDVRTVQILEKDDLRLNLNIFDLDTVVAKIIQPYLDLHQEQFTLTNLVKNSSIYVKIDFESIQQAIDNIIENAIKQTDNETRRIEIIIAKEDEKGKILIKDNGVGIEKSHSKDIFGKYVSFQTDKSAIGTGIGLYIAQEIVVAHNGKLTATSQGRGYGATFTITIPLYKTPNP
jgi:two-component system sensor histidine kinase VicK